MALKNDNKDQGARNWKGVESEQSKERRAKRERKSDQETVDFLRKRRGRP